MAVQAGIYVRLSVFRDGSESASPERQEAECRALCERNGWDVAGIYSDLDKSAFKPDAKRPDYARLLADLTAGHLGAVVFWKLDRAERKGLVAIVDLLKACQAHDAKLDAVHDPVDISTSMGRMFLVFQAEQAHQESKNTSIRVKGYQREAARQGRWHTGGHRSFGYERDGSVVPHEAELIQTAASDILDGASLWSIAVEWNARDVGTTAGNQWSASSVGQMFRSHLLTGHRLYEGEVYKGNWEPIITLETFAGIQEQLAKGRTMTARRTGRHLLTGFFRCALCKQNLQRRVFNQPHTETAFERYQCVREPGRVSCGKTAATMVGADKVATAKVLARWSLSPAGQVTEPAEDGHLENVYKQLEHLKAERDQATTERYIEESMSDEQWQTVKRALSGRIKECEVEIDRLTAQADRLPVDVPTDPDALAEWWTDATVEDRRSLISRVVDRIELHPAKRRGGNVFDPERMQFFWRKAD